MSRTLSFHTTVNTLPYVAINWGTIVVDTSSLWKEGGEDDK